MEKDTIQPELQDIITSLHRYLAVRKNNACFVLSFMAFNNGVCEDCGEERDDIVDDKGSRIFAYGDRQDLRLLLNDLRDTIEDEPDDEEQEGFVNI